MRERLPDSTPDNTDDRITPARAGKTILIHRSYLPHQDHPRSCGKDATSHSRNPLLGGSPPLVRERLSAGKASRRFSRITPARAGKTSILEPTWFRLGDHPRSCGKDMMSKSVIDTDMGSPPLVRERRKSNRADGREPRITPARAGKTLRIYAPARIFWDHPRSCWKDISPIPDNIYPAGSPPLVRERPGVRVIPIHPRRITPARAGKTVMDSFIFALLRLLTFKIYSTSLPNI